MKKQLTTIQKEYLQAVWNNGIHPFITGGKAKKRFLKAEQALAEECPEFIGKNAFEIARVLGVNPWEA